MQQQVPVDLLFQIIGEMTVEKRLMARQAQALTERVTQLQKQNEELGRTISADYGEPE